MFSRGMTVITHCSGIKHSLYLEGVGTDIVLRFVEESSASTSTVQAVVIC